MIKILNKMENETNQTDANKELNKRTYVQKFFKIAGIILLIFGIIIVCLIKYYTSWSTLGFIVTLVFVIVISLTMIFVFKIQAFLGNYKSLKEKIQDNLPEAITPEDASKFAQYLVMSPQYSDMIPYPKETKIITVGKTIKSSIYHYCATGVFPPYIHYDILINMHDPRKKHTILVNAPHGSIISSANHLAKQQDEHPDEEYIESEDELTGRKTMIVKKKWQKDQEEAKKREDL